MSKKNVAVEQQERCPKCQSTNFATSADGILRYCTLPSPDDDSNQANFETVLDDEGNPQLKPLPKSKRYNGIAAKGCGATWRKQSAEEVKLDYASQRNKINAELAKQARALIFAFEKSTNGISPAEAVVAMGDLHSVLKDKLAQIEHSL